MTAEITMQILKDLEAFKAEHNATLKQAQSEYDLATEKLEKLEDTQRALEETLKSNFTLTGKKNSIANRIKIESALKSVKDARELLESAKSNKTHVMTEEIKEQYTAYVDKKYNYTQKANSIVANMDNLVKQINEFIELDREIQKETMAIKDDLITYTDIPHDRSYTKGIVLKVISNTDMNEIFNSTQAKIKYNIYDLLHELPRIQY